MKDEGTQYMDLLRGTTELSTYSTLESGHQAAGPDTYRTENLQFPDMFPWNFPRSPGDQLAQPGLSGVLGTAHPQSELWWQVLVSGSPGQIPALGLQETGASDRSYGSPSDKFEAFADVQIRVNGTRLVRDQENAPQLTKNHHFGGSANCSFTQGNDIHHHDPGLFLNASQGQSPQASPRQFEQATSTHPICPIPGQHHWDKAVRATAYTDPQRVPATQSVQNIDCAGQGLKKWLCSRSGCNKGYRRKQELKRHTKDKHEDPDDCPFCYFTWTRPERMGRHLLEQHRRHFTKEKHGEIRGLRGREDMLVFLARCRTTRGPERYPVLCAGSQLIPTVSLVET